jgi:hypothetical protein|tara:strand:- start:644 stop:1039 length:396 start_codon:yes stop_codon:yes gene_type:complete
MVTAKQTLLPRGGRTMKTTQAINKYKAIALNKANTKFNEVYNSLSSKEKSSMEKKGMNRNDVKDAYLTETGALGFKQFFRGFMDNKAMITYNKGASEFAEKLQPKLMQSIRSFVIKGLKSGSKAIALDDNL